MGLFNFNNKKDESATQKSNVDSKETSKEEVKSDPKVIVSRSELDEVLEVTKGDTVINIFAYELTVRRDATWADKKWRVIGTGGSIIVNNEELDHIYSEFKRFNK